MKIRRSFVTNSSSSSYLLGSAEDNLTKDIVYRMVRDLYKELEDIKDRIVAMSEERDGILYCEQYGLTWDPDPEVPHFDWEWDDEKLKCLKADLGVDPEVMHLYFGHDMGWLDLETYEEFETYWKKAAFQPFSIIDLRGQAVTDWWNDDRDCDANVFWYYIGCDGTLQWREKDWWEEGHFTWDCSDCSFDRDDERCLEYYRAVKEGRITRQNCAEVMLGRFYIESRDGQMPFYVQDRLAELCRFGCCHMG